MVNNNQKENLPNASIVLILGIISIALCWCQGIVGVILAIAALVLASKDFTLYETNPEKYTESSYSNLKTGRTIAIIGLVLAGLFLFLLLISFLFFGLNLVMFPWEMIEDFRY